MDNQIKTSEAITIRYITEDAQRLRAEAKAAGCSLSELIRERSLRADMEAELLKIAEYNVDELSFPIGDLHATNRRAIVQKLCAQAVRVFHCPAGYGSTIRKFTEWPLCNLHMVSPFHTALRLPVSRQALNGYRILSAPSSLILLMQ